MQKLLASGVLSSKNGSKKVEVSLVTAKIQVMAIAILKILEKLRHSRASRAINNCSSDHVSGLTCLRTPHVARQASYQSFWVNLSTIDSSSKAQLFTLLLPMECRILMEGRSFLAIAKIFLDRSFHADVDTKRAEGMGCIHFSQVDGIGL